MKKLFCKKIASCLCIKRSSSPSPEPRLMMYRNARVTDLSNGVNDNNIKAPSLETTEHESMKMLKEIRDLLNTRICDHLDGLLGKEEQRNEVYKPCCKTNKENEMNDWKLAAAVIDRICAIVLTIVYVVGNVMFFVLFSNHP